MGEPFPPGRNKSNNDWQPVDGDKLEPIPSYDSKSRRWVNANRGGNFPVGAIVGVINVVGQLFNNDGGTDVATVDTPSATPPPDGSGTGNSDTGDSGDSGTSGDSGNAGTNESDISRFADVLAKLYGQSVTIPSGGSPTVVPTQTSSTSAVPLLLIVGGLGVFGYLLYKKSGGDN